MKIKISLFKKELEISKEEMQFILDEAIRGEDAGIEGWVAIMSMFMQLK